MALQNISGTVDRLAAAADTPAPTAFITESGPTGWENAFERIEDLIERYPWPTLLIALGVGYMISRRLR